MNEFTQFNELKRRKKHEKKRIMMKKINKKWTANNDEAKKNYNIDFYRWKSEEEERNRQWRIDGRGKGDSIA